MIGPPTIWSHPWSGKGIALSALGPGVAWTGCQMPGAVSNQLDEANRGSPAASVIAPHLQSRRAEVSCCASIRFDQGVSIDWQENMGIVLIVLGSASRTRAIRCPVR